MEKTMYRYKTDLVDIEIVEVERSNKEEYVVIVDANLYKQFTEYVFYDYDAATRFANALRVVKDII